MRNILLLIIMSIFFNKYSKAQTCTNLIKYDYIETWNWSSGWSLGPNTGYYNNAFVTSTSSAALIGAGSGTSGIESGYYVLPNITGLNSSSSYMLSFKLGSYRFTSTGATSGVDVPDYVDLQLSTNGGVSYVSELRVTGNNNAYWGYASTAIASKTANGLLTTFTPGGGGDRTLTGDGYSNIKLTLPAGLTQCAFYIYCRVNSTGEEWWIDNIELLEIVTCDPLPIELISFEGYKSKLYNNIVWVTASENNNDYFTLERSYNGVDWIIVTDLNGAGTVSTPSLYEYKDYEFIKNVYNYYRLKQTDFNGQYKYFNIISINNLNKETPKLIKVIDILGQEVPESYVGLVIEIYSDGEVKKVYKQ